MYGNPKPEYHKPILTPIIYNPHINPKYTLYKPLCMETLQCKAQVSRAMCLHSPTTLSAAGSQGSHHNTASG